VTANVLALELRPLLPMRTPNGCGFFEYGFAPVLPDGTALRPDDPLLRAFGAVVLHLDSDDLDGEALQGDAFAPGRRLQLETELDDEDDLVVAVWDEERIRRVGELDEDDADTAVVLSALDHGLPMRAAVLRELRTAAGDRRSLIFMLAYSERFVRVGAPADLRLERPSRPRRKRVVLVAGAGGVHFWDPASDAGPAASDDLPLSTELKADLGALQHELAEAASAGGFEGWWRGEAIEERAIKLWARARRELGRTFAVGLLGPDMDRPVWRPAELEEISVGDDDILF
jgi:hypothetical protein